MFAAGSCSFAINTVPSYLDVTGAFHLTGVVDNRVDDDSDFVIRVQVTKVAYQGVTTFGSCTVDAAVCNVSILLFFFLFFWLLKAKALN